MENPETKICICCKIEKFLSDFNKKRDTKDGYNAICKICSRIRDKQHYEDNKEKIAKRKKQHYEDNKEILSKKYKLYRNDNKTTIATKMRQYRKDNQEKVAKSSKKHYENNKETILKYHKQFYEDNKETIAITAKKYRKDNKETIAISVKKHYEDNKEIILKKRSEYAKTHRDKLNILNQTRKARKKQLAHTLTDEEWSQIKKDFNYKCAYCEEVLPLTQDHLIPLSKGGNYIKENIIPACRSCNCSKQDKDFNTWYLNQPFYNKDSFILKYINKEVK